MHHVAQKLPGREADLVIEQVRLLLVDAHDSLIALEERQGAITLQVKIKSTNDLLFNNNQLGPVDLLAEKVWQTFDHHVEARVHVLVHLCCEQDAYRGQLYQVRRFLSLCGKYSEISVCDADCQIEGVLSVPLYTMKLLDERDHRLAVLWCNPE